MSALVVAVWGLVGAGCVAAKYRLARTDQGAPRPAALEIGAAAPTAAATLHAVIVFHGPGSWKRDAYWDEYVVTVTATGAGAWQVEHAVLVDPAGGITPAGYDPWAVEKTSRERLKVARHTGRTIVLGAGAGAAWLGSLALFASNVTICGGVANTTAATVGATGVVAIPMIALGSGVRSLVARGRIAREFNRRRIALPAPVPAGTSRTGSFFFPVTPAPRQLRLRGRDHHGAGQEMVIDLAPLAGLHLPPVSAPAAGAPPAAPPVHGS